MYITPLGPWEVGGSVGPVAAGLQGRYGRVENPVHIRCEQGGKGVNLGIRITYYVLVP